MLLSPDNQTHNAMLYQVQENRINKNFFLNYMYSSYVFSDLLTFFLCLLAIKDFTFYFND